MKVYMGPYKNWVGPYQVAHVITKIGFSEEKADKLGEWLCDTWVEKFLNWMHKKKKRKIKVRIDQYDTWGMYETLSVIIAPMLRQLRDEKMGYALVDNKDVPPELRTKKKTYSDEDKDVAKWNYVLGEMIFAFETYEARVLHDIDWEDQYHSGEIDMYSVEEEKNGMKYFTMEYGPNHTHKVDTEGMKAHADRLKNGFELFGKYYLNLWD